jgi:hypothetical protein
MPNARTLQQWRAGLPDALARTLGAAWGLVLVGVLFIAVRDHHPVFASRFECGTDPRDILRAGELLDRPTLWFVVEAHCANARYLPGRIELLYGGMPVDVRTRRIDIAGTTYYAIVSVGELEETP